MRPLLILPALFLTLLVACNDDYSSYPPTFSDMMFQDSTGQAIDTVAMGQPFTATMSMGAASQNVYIQIAEWKAPEGIKYEAGSLIDRNLPTARFTVADSIAEGPRDIKLELTYGVSGNETRQMADYTTSTGLNVKYTQPWAGVVGHYILTCTKKIYVRR